MFCKRNE